MQDAKTYAAWGVDYLKYDRCAARNIYTAEEMQAVYQKLGDALLTAGRASGRPIVFSLCQYGNDDVWKWGPDLGNLWRTTGDSRDAWDSMTKIGFAQSDLAQWARPGHWNYPDMLEIGNGMMSDTEYRTHMSLWSMPAAPLLAGNDQRDMTPAIKEILMNREVIVIDQAKAWKQGKRMSRSGDQESWVRDLDGGAKAVALLSRGGDAAKMSVKWKDVGATGKARDLWAHADVKVEGEEFAATVQIHGVVMLRVSK
jgi:alpha-galactosidase